MLATSLPQVYPSTSDMLHYTNTGTYLLQAHLNSAYTFCLSQRLFSFYNAQRYFLQLKEAFLTTNTATMHKAAYKGQQINLEAKTSLEKHL